MISLDIRSSLGFRIGFRFGVGIRCRIPHDTHGSVTYIYTLACDTFLAHTHLWVSMGGETGTIQGERVLFIGTQFSILYTFMYSPAEAATPRA